MNRPPSGAAAHEKKPNAPVTIQHGEPEDFIDLDADGDLFGTDDLVGIDVAVDDEGASE